MSRLRDRVRQWAEITVPVQRIGAILVLGVLLLLLAHIVSWSIGGPLFQRFDVSNEANVPTWFSSILFFSVSLGGLLAYLMDDRSYPRLYFHPHYWLVLSAIFLYFSLDEVAQLHELIDGELGIKWVYVYAPFTGAFYALSLYHLLSLRRRDRFMCYWILYGILVLGLGGMGLEIFDHLASPLSPMVQLIEVLLEEGLEMIGVIMVLMGCLCEVSRLWLKRSGTGPEAPA